MARMASRTAERPTRKILASSRSDGKRSPDCRRPDTIRSRTCSMIPSDTRVFWTTRKASGLTTSMQDLLRSELRKTLYVKKRLSDQVTLGHRQRSEERRVGK